MYTLSCRAIFATFEKLGEFFDRLLCLMDPVLGYLSLEDCLVPPTLPPPLIPFLVLRVQIARIWQSRGNKNVLFIEQQTDEILPEWAVEVEGIIPYLCTSHQATSNKHIKI